VDGVLHADPNILVSFDNQAVGHMLGLVLGQIVVVEFNDFLSMAH
jgi:ABC-type xylose transport system substrate-binding protein